MKRLLLFICTLLCANVLLAQTRFWVGNLQYEVTSTNPAEVMVYDANLTITTANIPATVSYSGITYSVTSIGDYAFYNCSSLTSIDIPNSVTSIGDDAFYYCSSLTSVTIPNSVTSIGNGAFCACSALTSVTIPNSVTSIGDDAFYDCSSITSITIPNSVTTIGESAFNYCSSLTSVTIPNSVTEIGDWAFCACSSLTSVTIGNSVTSIGAYAFYNCSSLTSIDIPNSVTFIGDDAFKNCSNLTSVTIPNSVTSIGDDAFYYCSSLTSVTIGNSVTSIGNYAFCACSSLTSVTIPNSVISIGTGAFKSCSSLTSVTLPNNATISNNAFEGIIITIDSISYAGRDTLVIGNYTLTNIGFITFYLNDTAYNSIDLIGEVVVYACDESKSGDLIIPSTININGNNFNVISIDELAFWGCSNLTSITIPNSVTSIGAYAFYDCSSLSSFTCLAVNPPTLDYDVFYNTPNEKSLIVPCGALDNYINSEWNDYFADRITEEEGYNAVANVNNDDFGSVTVEGECYSATLTAVANACYGFLNWNDGNTENPRLVTLSSDSVFTANFGEMVVNNNITATICQGQTYNENGFNVSEAGVYTLNLQTVNGCDSVVTLNLNVNPVYNTDLFASICEGEVYNENGFNVNEAGVYSRTLQAVNGCDSVVNLTLSVIPIFNTNLSAFICEGETYSENGFNVSEAGTYTQSLQSVLGCDSVITLTLNVNPVFNTPLTATICEGSVYNENGFNVSEAGTYTQSLQSVNGCDSIVTLTLNVTPSYHTNLTATICEGSELNISGFNVSEAGVYTQSFTAVNGCDSVVTLTVTALPVYNTNLTLTICEGTSLNFSGFNVTEGGVYTQSFTAVNGCDSIVTLTVTELPIIHTDLTLSICEGTTLNFSGFNVSEAGTYTQTHTAANGCDSIVTLLVTTYPTFDTTITATINAGEMYSEFGFNESEAGTYVQNLQTVNGCDSTITLILNVNSSLMDVEHSELSFYPNPTNSKITFSSTIESIEVIDLTGRCVLTFSNAREINIESLPSGAYYLRLTNDEKTIMQKVIKQ